MIGAGLRARRPAGQGSEVVLGCAILNRMTALGRPVSYRLDRGGSCRWASCGPVTIRATTPRVRAAGPDTARLCAADRAQVNTAGPASGRGTRGNRAGRRRRPRARARRRAYPPRGPRPSVRDRTISTGKSIGRCRWTQTSRDQQQARVENALFRDQSMIGDGLRAKIPVGRTTETLLACTRAIR